MKNVSLLGWSMMVNLYLVSSRNFFFFISSFQIGKKNHFQEIKWKLSESQLDVDPRRDDDASPMSSYRCMLRPTRMISALRHKSKFNFELKKKTSQNSISNFFKSDFYDSMCCSILEELSIDVSIANVGLILTKLRWFQLFVKSQSSNFELFWKKIQILGFPSCSTREDLSIDASITNVGLILTKLMWFQHFSTSQNSNFELFWKKKSNFWVSMV